VKYKRGYPVAVLVSLGIDRAHVWMIFSHVAKLEKTILFKGDRRDSRAVYSFHESLVNALRLRVKEGIKNIIVASPPKSDYDKDFAQHVRDHHMWLVQGQNKLVLSTIIGSAGSSPEATELMRRPEFRKLISEAASEEGENLLDVFEQSLAASESRISIFYSLDEIERVILDKSASVKLKPDYLLLTTKYLAQSRQKGRLNRLMQIAQNRGMKTRIVEADSRSGLRLTQFGGIVCIAKSE